MPITQLSALTVNAPYTLDSPEVQDYLRAVSSRQQTTTSYPFMVYVDDRNPGLFYLLSAWDTPAAHINWTTENNDLITMGYPLATLQLAVHLDMEFAQIPVDANFIAYMKFDAKPRDPESGPGQLWLGHGANMENGNEIYQFSAFTELDRTSGMPEDCIIMKRLRL